MKMAGTSPPEGEPLRQPTMRPLMQKREYDSTSSFTPQVGFARLGNFSKSTLAPTARWTRHRRSRIRRADRTCDVRHATCASDITTFRLAAVACRIVESRSRMSRVARRTSKTTIPQPEAPTMAIPARPQRARRPLSQWPARPEAAPYRSPPADQNQSENQFDGSSTLETDAKSDTGTVLDSGPRESVRNQACGTPAFSAVCGAGRSDAFQP